MSVSEIETPTTERTPEEIDEIIQKEFVTDYIEGFVEVGEEKTCMAKYYTQYEDAIKNFNVYEDDVYVISYLKTGTTWTQEMVWLIANDLDFERAKVPLPERFPFIEFSTSHNCKKLDMDLKMESPDFLKDSVNFTVNLPRPRFIKTHLPFSLLPQQIKDGVKFPKIIYVMRNPKDVCVSYYHHGRCFNEWWPTFDDFVDVFLSDKIMWGSFWKHVLGYWQQRNLLNMLIITYEDMKKDLAAVIKKVAKFLEKEMTDEQVNLLLDHLSFESMKNNEFVNYENVLSERRKRNMKVEGAFMRCGTVGSYKNEMNEEHLRRMAVWTKKHIKNTDFAVDYPDLAKI